jgi:signal transduction histidine kinase
MMGGEILVDSALGAGSTFTFVVTLPVAEGAVALKAA